MALRGCPRCQAAATLPCQAAVGPRCPHPSREDGEGASSPSVAPKSGQGSAEPQGDTAWGQLIHAGPYLAPLAVSSLRWWQSCDRRGDSEGEQQSSLRFPLFAAFGFAGTSIKELLQALGPPPGGTSQVAVSQGTGWALLCPHPAPCTYPVPKECPQKMMLLFPLRAFAQS